MNNKEGLIKFKNKVYTYHEDLFANLIYRKGVLESYLNQCNELFIENYKLGGIRISEGYEVGTITMNLRQVSNSENEEFNILEGKNLFDFYGLPLSLLGKEEELSWCDEYQR